MTKNEIIAELKAKGIEFNSRDSKAKLEALLPFEEEATVEEIIEKEEVESEIIEEIVAEEEANERMDIIGQNGNTGEHYDEAEDLEKEKDAEEAVEGFTEEEIKDIEADVEELVEVIATKDEEGAMNVEEFWDMYEAAERMIVSLVEESNKISDLKPLSRRLKPLSRSVQKFKRFKK